LFLGSAGEFTVKHYAGDVTYNMEGFCDKNRDMLFNDLIDLANCTNSSCKTAETTFHTRVSISSSSFISAVIPQLFPEASQAPDKRRPTSAGHKIKDSINQLVEALSLCSPHYIRCIKPNEKKRAGGEFDICRSFVPLFLSFNRFSTYTFLQITTRIFPSIKSSISVCWRTFVCVVPVMPFVSSMTSSSSAIVCARRKRGPTGAAAMMVQRIPFCRLSTCSSVRVIRRVCSI
jgi:hypothetical protein